VIDQVARVVEQAALVEIDRRQMGVSRALSSDGSAERRRFFKVANGPVMRIERRLTARVASYRLGRMLGAVA
jgi:hypothetical protein